MSHYNFKRIGPIPTEKDFVDIVLSKTQRKTPTVVHKQYQISRIRNFYTRKIKFAQQTFHDKLHQILSEFPKLDDIHPFYSDLMNILYDKDHYKLALGQLNMTMQSIDRISKQYVKTLKFSDSLFQCKRLKIAALGRFVKLIMGQKKSLIYLEEVRQHLARLPSIDPNTRTLLLCGFPNVGKSSFINTITRADVDVQPYAFTTKSLFVGHTDYSTLRYQVIDTPGLLDRPIEERNTIEMQAITALTHLRAYVIYIIDPSEQCGYSIKTQIELFESLRGVFKSKMKLLVLNKTDVKKREELSDENKQILDDLEKKEVKIMEMSTMTEEGVTDVKNLACLTLLTERTQTKRIIGKAESILNRLHVAMPAARDNKDRAPFIPESVLLKRAAAAAAGEAGAAAANAVDKRGRPLVKKVPTKKTERDIEMEEGGDYFLDLKKNYLLENEDEKYDTIPEIWLGHNIADFIDPEIEQKLIDLEKEEGLRESAGFYEEVEDDEEDRDIRFVAEKIREKQKLMMVESGEKRRVEGPRMPRTAKRMDVNKMKDKLSEGGVFIDVDDDKTHLGKARSRSIATRDSRKRKREASESRGRSQSRNRSVSRVPPRNKSGVRDEKMETKVRKLAKMAQRKMNLESRKGEADRRILTSRPKHLFSGKRKMGKNDRR